MMEDEVAALVVDNGSGKVRQLSDNEKHIFFEPKIERIRKKVAFQAKIVIAQ